MSEPIFPGGAPARPPRNVALTTLVVLALVVAIVGFILIIVGSTPDKSL